MNVRLVEYFVAVAREHHFGRAAALCHVSQPTLSAGLLALEEQLGMRLVERDRRFIGLTDDRRAVLPWAQHVVAGFDGMTAVAGYRRGSLRGTLRLGAIPASMPAVGLLGKAMRATHPAVALNVRSLTSREIERGVAAFELDAGLTYIEHEPPERVIAVPLYGERAMFVTSDAYPLPRCNSINWEDALAHPLCLLHQDMQNRRILDEQLARHGLTARPWATADSYVTLAAMIRSGDFATIMPDTYATLLPRWARMLPFDGIVEPSVIGLVVADHPPISPMAEAVLAVARRLEVPTAFDTWR